jgi:hypothetical protein
MHSKLIKLGLCVKSGSLCRSHTLNVIVKLDLFFITLNYSVILYGC